MLLVAGMVLAVPGTLPEDRQAAEVGSPPVVGDSLPVRDSLLEVHSQLVLQETGMYKLWLKLTKDIS